MQRVSLSQQGTSETHRPRDLGFWQTCIAESPGEAFGRGRIFSGGSRMSGAAINSMVDEWIPVGLTAGTAHPMDSSRVLMALLSLSRVAQTTEPETDNLDGIVSPRVLQRILSALQFRDEATLSHARRVACMATGMGTRLGWEGRPLRILEVAALLHDVGKIGVPDHILLKPAKLSPDEADFMSAQHDVGVQLLQACRIDPAVIQMISETLRCNDGDLSGNGVSSQGARILSVADAFDSLSNDQVYRRGLDREEVLNVLASKAGRQFDRNIVVALARWLETDGSFLYRPDPEARTTNCNAVVNWETVREASIMGHIVSYLYLIETLYDGFYIVDSDLRVAVWNRGAENLFGLPAGDALSQKWSRRLGNFVDEHGRTLNESEYPLSVVMETCRPASLTCQLVRENEEREHMEILSLPLLDHEGRLQGVAEIFRNLSGVKRNPGRYRELQWAATRDPLTGVANRGALQEKLLELHESWLEGGSSWPLSIMFLDIDHFKSINDQFDHSTGDRVLIDLVRMLQDELYSGEMVGRYGGEEFVIICPETHLHRAVERAERLRRSVMAMEVSSLPELNVTASFGIAQLEPGDTVDTLLQRADKALYDAKHGGRNRCCHATTKQAKPGRRVAVAAEPKNEPFVHRASFLSCDAAGVIVHKLGGFVDDNRGKVLDCTPDSVVIRIGRAGLLSGWGKLPNQQPVRLELELGGFDDAPNSRAASKRREIRATVRPETVPIDEASFKVRAAQVVELLRSHCVAE
jgi:diguanylate cyclase (GGDEF)-like protein